MPEQALDGIPLGLELVMKMYHVYCVCHPGFRHRVSTLHDLEFYLPAPCYGLSSNTIRALMFHLQIVLEENGCSKDDCPLENIFLQCPQVSGSVTFFNDIP